MKMTNEIKDGTWATMLTPFDSDNRVDYNALSELIEWYIENGVDGLFAVCQSSEMLFLNAAEREEVSRFVMRKVNGRVQVVISGHVSDCSNEQIEELKIAASCNPDAVVLVTNRLAEEAEDDEVWKKNAEKILTALPNIRFGLYECPKPYKRLLSPKLLKWCASTGRFVFLKDTSCDMEQIKAKLLAINGTGLKLFNANSATLLSSLKAGANGFCGIMLNFFPKPFNEICSHFNDLSWQHRVELLQDFATAASLIELQLYPINAKYYLSKSGINISVYSRSCDITKWNRLREIETDSLRGLCSSVLKLVESMND